jgi:hypothetical protein
MPLKTALSRLFSWLRGEVWPNLVDSFSRRGGYEGREFYIQPIPFALTQCVSGLIPLLLILLHGPAHLRSLVLILFAVKITVGTFIAAIIVSRVFPILVGKNGLRGRNLMGEARRVEWNQIKSAHFMMWMGFAPLVRISTFKRANVIWLPLYLDKRTEFEATVREWAPQGNPLREIFEK